MNDMEEQNFEKFKENLLDFLTTNFIICHRFRDKYILINNISDLKKLLIEFNTNIYQALGGNFDDYEDEIWDLENENDELKKDIEILRDELREDKLMFKYDSYDNEIKMNAFKEYHNNYTAWELDELLQNGKKYLNENIINK